MNASSLIQRAGLAVQKTVAGELLILVLDANTTVMITATVNRNIVKGRDFMRLFKDFAGDFEVMGLTEVEILKSDLATAPEAGQYLTDSYSYKHRVRYTSQTDVSWLIYCTPSAAS